MPDIEEQEPAEIPQRICPRCGKSILKDSLWCRYCQSEYEALPNPQEMTPEEKAKELEQLFGDYSRGVYSIPYRETRIRALVGRYLTFSDTLMPASQARLVEEVRNSPAIKR